MHGGTIIIMSGVVRMPLPNMVLSLFKLNSVFSSEFLNMVKAMKIQSITVDFKTINHMVLILFTANMYTVCACIYLLQETWYLS